MSSTNYSNQYRPFDFKNYSDMRTNQGVVCTQSVEQKCLRSSYRYDTEHVKRQKKLVDYNAGTQQNLEDKILYLHDLNQSCQYSIPHSDNDNESEMIS